MHAQQSNPRWGLSGGFAGTIISTVNIVNQDCDNIVVTKTTIINTVHEHQFNDSNCQY